MQGKECKECAIRSAISSVLLEIGECQFKEGSARFGVQVMRRVQGWESKKGSARERVHGGECNQEQSGGCLCKEGSEWREVK
jgi:hypothetical protein